MQRNDLQYRNELKYVCSESDLAIIENQIKPLCSLDSYAGVTGTYEIRSIYFDDSENRCFYENEDGTDPREKFRIRIYNGNSARISLECKRKERGMTHKESCLLTMEQYRGLIDGTYMRDGTEEKLLLKLLLQVQERFLRPKIIVQYVRTPYIYPVGNVRITFDRNLGSSIDIEDFLESNVPCRPVMPLGKQILEVKYNEILPDYLYQVMNLNDLYQATFSKYYICRKYAGGIGI